uniref:Uncharacterized protein n=1 Tax=Arundo donax TaxID=35708 RepID=A0A0A9DZ83_ARUDO
MPVYYAHTLPLPFLHLLFDKCRSGSIIRIVKHLDQEV